VPRGRLLLAVVIAVAAPATAGAFTHAAGTPVVAAYPSSLTISPTGTLPAGGVAQLEYNTAIGERDGAIVLVHGAKSVVASVDPGNLGGIGVALSLGHYVRIGGKLVPDALVPWDGVAHPTEQQNQPIYVQVIVPPSTNAGLYSATLTVNADSVETKLPIKVKVFNVALPAPGKPGNLLTSFHLAAETYINRVDKVFGFKSNADRLAANFELYKFLASYKISPSSWGYGEPQTPAGYAPDKRWWKDSAGNMTQEAGGDGQPAFSDMRIPISSNRASSRNLIAGLSPSHPETWCTYLTAVHDFWQQRGWLPATVPYLYGQDEPGLAGQHLVSQQAEVAHKCFPGSKVLMTGNPSPTGANDFLLDNKGSGLDIFVVLSVRFYGVFTVPAQQKAGADRSHQSYKAIQKALTRGKMIWSYSYGGSATPGLSGNEPLSDARMFMLWNALEHNTGVLYGEGMTSYGPGNPLDALDRNGDFALIYPGAKKPVPSARLEQVRDGIDDWEIFDAVRRKLGLGKVRAILGQAGLFSADASGVKLACSIGCDITNKNPNAWPVFSQDATTPARIEAAKLAALKALG
jgi:hypothetical protein